MKWRNRRGFTLIEVIVAITIMGMILPLVGTAMYQFIKVPPEQTDELTVINEVRQVAEWIVEDGTQSTFFAPTLQFWRFAPEGKQEFVAGYKLAVDGTLTRYTDYSDAASGVVIAQHINDPNDLDYLKEPTGLVFKSQPNYLKVDIVSTINGIGGQTQDSGTVFVFLKSAPQLPLTYAIFCGPGGLTITGGSKTIDGNVYSGGTVSIGGNKNTITGTLEAPDVSVDGANPDPELIEPWTEHGFPPIWMPEQFQPGWYDGPYFTDFGDTLNGVLEPGVYYSDSKVTIGAGTTGHVTIIAPTIKVTGNGVNLTAYYGGMLLWATAGDIYGAPGQKAIEISSNDAYFQGFIYASDPDATVSISSQGGTVINGSIIANAVIISGDLWLVAR